MRLTTVLALLLMLATRLSRVLEVDGEVGVVGFLTTSCRRALINARILSYYVIVLGIIEKINLPFFATADEVILLGKGIMLLLDIFEKFFLKAATETPHSLNSFLSN